LKTKPYLSLKELMALALLLASSLQAQSLAGSYADAFGARAKNVIIGATENCPSRRASAFSLGATLTPALSMGLREVRL